jgi:hypothetical protein
MCEIVLHRKNESGRQYSATIITAEELNKIKRKALRRKVWFKALNPMERALIDLVIKVVEHVKSPKLAKIITRIIGRLREALKSRIEKLMETVGRSLALRHAECACSWGYKDALKWAADPDFIRYLTIVGMNKR